MLGTWSRGLLTGCRWSADWMLLGQASQCLRCLYVCNCGSGLGERWGRSDGFALRLFAMASTGLQVYGNPVGCNPWVVLFIRQRVGIKDLG